MTRPIYEPSLTRADAYLDFQQQQLFRRPAPAAGGTTGPYAMIRWEDGATIASATPTTLASLTDFELGYISDPSLISVDLTSGKIILDTTAGPGADTLPGLWIAHLKTTWSGNFTGDLYGLINWTMGTGKVLDDVQGRQFYSKTQPGGATFNSTEVCDGTSIVIVLDNGAGNNWVTGSLMQVSAGSQDLEHVTLTVERLEEYPTADGIFVP